MLNAVNQECILLTHDFRRDLENGTGALVETFDQPVGVIEAFRQVGFRLGVGRELADLCLVLLVHEYAGQRLRIQLDGPASVGALAHGHP